MSPSQFNNFIMESYSSFWKTAADKKVQAAIRQAEESGGLVNVNEVIKDLSDDGEEMYFAGLNVRGFKEDPGDKARSHIFQNSVYAGIIEARKALQGYNEGVIKQQEGFYQVYNNNGMYEPAKELGKTWRTILDDNATNGNLGKDFYFTSKDYFKPMAVAKSPSGGDTIKGNNEAFEKAINWMDEWFVTNGQTGRSPSAVFEYLKDVIEVPEEYKNQFLDKEGNKTRSFEAHIQKRFLDELVKTYKSEGDVKRIHDG
jgi:hypothetical protein